MTFAVDKKNFLSKKDKSKAGRIDEGIARLCELINALPDYFTTSSCAGRTVLINHEGTRKDQCNWFFKSHDTDFTGADLLVSLKPQTSNPKALKGTTWLKYEPFIVHVRCKDMDAATRLLKVAKECGLRKAGINGISKTYVIELEGNDRLETLVATDEVLVTLDYLNSLVGQLKEKVKRNIKKIKRLERFIEQRLQ